ncbi:unnamed protein product [Strongylus vulgaris]|uniref:Protein kinase domain-containing protein n=1 Tax=Strongylus vulgaris TaxID=40348 RepID=A0A3P7JHX8_STRVU|nr:unnamed protein product [Strongylus vulgaris]
MGAQESVNKRRDEDIVVDDEVPRNAAAFKLWTHIYPALRNKRVPCTVFLRKLEGADGALKYFENGIKLLKQLKHPNIVKFLEGACSVSDVSLITERVEMLDLSVRSMSIVEIQCGLHHILEALLFLHSKASLSHNNISPGCIFVCNNGEWKLGGFEFTSSPNLISEITESKFFKSGTLPEFAPTKESNVSAQQFANDTFGFGKLIEYVLLDFSDEAVKLSLSAMLDHPALKNDLTELINFCSTIQLRESEEKQDFYEIGLLRTILLRSIVRRLRSLPGEVMAKRLCRLLLSRYVTAIFVSVVNKLTSQLQDENEGILSRELYDAFMVPELLRLFRVREAAVRIALLSQFSRFATYIPHDRLGGFVTDEVLQGCHDSNSSLVSSSLRALATLVDILGAEAVCPWTTTKKFGTDSPQRNRPAKNVFGFNFLRMDSSSSTNKARLDESEKPVLVPTTNIEKDWAEDDKTDWNDIPWSAEWRENSESASAENRDVSPSPDVTIVRKSKPLKLHAPISQKSSSSDFKKASAIGSEFEISVVPQKTIEDDLFADLTPNLPTPTPLIERLKALQQAATPVSICSSS